MAHIVVGESPWPLDRRLRTPVCVATWEGDGRGLRDGAASPVDLEIVALCCGFGEMSGHNYKIDGCQHVAPGTRSCRCAPGMGRSKALCG